ncbi:hypothetical protein PspLS_08320 [Pyricularia sp. CBS 133598]|nr:hypothetical protein PspLS_08320 [Pyricularia sp. CBS 133598]
MISGTRLRTAQKLASQIRVSSRAFTISARQLESGAATAVSASKTETAPKTTDPSLQPLEVLQAPNRTDIWARSQRSRSEAMTGPRFEQTDFAQQPQPYSAMELVHKEPVRWTHDRVVACDGGGGPAGHPRVFINVDKPEITPCGYCGLPFANEHHRKHLESLPKTSYPLA